MRTVRTCTTLIALVCVLFANLFAEQTVRVATYNIKKLSTNITQQGNRLEKLKEVIDLLDADVIGLQEIDNRAALGLVFPPSDWLLVIDDDSNDDQDVALAVRKPFSVHGFSGSNLDADAQHFLFPGAQDNTAFPRRRDLLCIEISIPNSSVTFFVMVHHAKSRYESDPDKGRATNDYRREMASQMIVERLEAAFHEADFFLLGDFNDNPDDRSLNILETGYPFAAAGPEENQGPFL